jgi:hypothetical protein
MVFFFGQLVLASSTTKTGHQWYSWNIAESGIKHQKLYFENEKKIVQFSKKIKCSVT